jgi:hypothetical protein
MEDSLTTPPAVASTSRLLYVVARDRPDLYAALREKFLESERLAIVLDRRGHATPPGVVRDERRRLAVEESLRTRGWARVRIDADGRAAIASDNHRGR